MFKNQTMQARLITAFIFMGVLVLLVGLIGWMGVKSLSDDISTITGNSLPSIDSLWSVKEGQTQVQAADRGLLNPVGDDDYRRFQYEKLEKAFNQINEGFQNYEKLPRDPDEDKLYQTLLPLFEKWKRGHEDLLQLQRDYDKADVDNAYKTVVNLLGQGKGNSPEFAKAKAAAELLEKASQQTIVSQRDLYNNAAQALQNVLNYNRDLSQKAKKAAARDIARTGLWILGALLLGPVVAIFFGIYFSNTIAKPLGAKIAGVVDAAQKISGGDLTAQVPPSEQQDELGKLQTAFSKMNRDLNTLIRQVQHSGIQITTSATQIAASGKQLEATVNQQVASTNEVVATAKEISATSIQLVKTMESVSQKSEETANNATDSQQGLTRMASTMSGLADATGSISTKLGTISDKANNINSIITTITKVADQTNLLSLNAAIEAEKAGEYGTGFAVVAREIRRLADQTAVATLDIENMVKEMQAAVTSGVMEMDKFTQEVERGVEDVGDIRAKLETIIEQVQTLTPRFQDVSNSVEAQSQGAVQISDAMVQLSEASSQTADSLREINGAIAQLNDAAHGLRQETSRFK